MTDASPPTDDLETPAPDAPRRRTKLRRRIKQRSGKWLRWVVRWAGVLVAKRRGEEVRARLEALAGELREAEFVVWAVEVERVVERECG